MPKLFGHEKKEVVQMFNSPVKKWTNTWSTPWQMDAAEGLLYFKEIQDCLPTQ